MAGWFELPSALKQPNCIMFWSSDLSHNLQAQIDQSGVEQPAMDICVSALIVLYFAAI